MVYTRNRREADTEGGGALCAADYYYRHIPRFGESDLPFTTCYIHFASSRPSQKKKATPVLSD